MTADEAGQITTQAQQDKRLSTEKAIAPIMALILGYVRQAAGAGKTMVRIDTTGTGKDRPDVEFTSRPVLDKLESLGYRVYDKSEPGFLTLEWPAIMPRTKVYPSRGFAE